MNLFAARRERFMEAMGGGVAIIRTNPLVTRSNDVEFPFRGDSTFWYLTGFREPDAVAVLTPDHAEHRFILFVNPKDPVKELWTGRRAGVEGAMSRYGADLAYPLDKLDEELPKYLENQPKLFFAIGADPQFDAQVIAWRKRAVRKIREGIVAPDVLVDLSSIASEQRLVKSPQEVDFMRRAAQIAAHAHQDAMRLTKPGLCESQLQAILEYRFRMGGAQSPSYNPICGSGPNSCILHYTENDRCIEPGDLILVDAGCEVEGYASDITRTFPATGMFTADQRALYNVVLDAQLACLDLVRPGTHFQAIHEMAVNKLTEGLVQLGILEGPASKAIEDESFKRFYMHKTSHWLGMDVHDVGNYRIAGQWRSLEPGMVLTVEPGLYVTADSDGVDPRWFNMGIRIEDDVLVTPDGHDVLSRDVPKRTEEIEALMRSAGSEAKLAALA